VEQFLVNRGDHVRQGQLLAILESHDLVAAAEESKGLNQQAQATYQTTTAGTLPEDLVKAKSGRRNGAPRPGSGENGLRQPAGAVPTGSFSTKNGR
jgi:multidrug efflux pump subunit AcrA (membrane-fusion protein)